MHDPKLIEAMARAMSDDAIKWEVFPNTDADVGGWYSYVEDATHYLGGDWHKTKAEAEKHARKIAKAAAIQRAGGAA